MTGPASRPYDSLKLTEARARGALLDVRSYDVELDLATSEETYASRTVVELTSTGGSTFLDLKPVAVSSVVLDGQPLDPALLHRGRLPLDLPAGEHRLEVDATMRFRNDGEGLHRSVDPADGRHYVYGMSFMDAAPSIFACFDQPDLKAPYTFHVDAPADWVVIGNAPGARVATEHRAGVGPVSRWELETSQPLSTYFVTLVAGPYAVLRDEHDGIGLGLSARQSIARHLEADADELLTMTKQCFDEFHRLFGIRYPFGDYHQAFVPEFNAGAMENPGCVTFRDPLVFTSRVPRGQRIQRATTVAHEMAHQWFGNLVTPAWWDDLWLNESFAEYMGNRVTADATEYGDAWVHNSHRRRQWGLVADQRPTTHPVAGNGADDASAALQDFDGISYAKGSSILRQLATSIGDDAFFGGAVDHFTRHRFGNATMHDLFASWESAGAGDLGAFTADWLRTAGVDTLTVDREAGVLRRTPPEGRPADRPHTLHVATADPASPGDGWRVDAVVVRGPETPLEVPAGAAVVVDALEDSWTLSAPDATTAAALPALLPATTDPALRAGIWNVVRSGFHNALVDPADAVEAYVAAIPTETEDDGVGAVTQWLLDRVVPATADPAAALVRVHDAAARRCASAEPGSGLQLAALHGMVASSSDADLLRAWRDGRDLPDGAVADEDLVWRTHVRLAVLGATDHAALDDALAAAPTAHARVEHARAVASLPTPAAKAWAWERFRGTVTVANYEVEATGLGMWRPGQEDLTAPYVDRYLTELPGLARVFSGWLLADVAESFFPRTSLSTATLDAVAELAGSPDLDASLRRRLLDAADDLRRRTAVREAWGGR